MDRLRRLTFWRRDESPSSPRPSSPAPSHPPHREKRERLVRRRRQTIPPLPVWGVGRGRERGLGGEGPPRRGALTVADSWKKKETAHGPTPLSPSDRSLLPAGGPALRRLRRRAVSASLGVRRLPRPGACDVPVCGQRHRLFLRRGCNSSERLFGAVHGRVGGSRGGRAGDGAAHGRGSGGRRDRHARRDGDPANSGEGAARLSRLWLQVPDGARNEEAVMSRARWVDLAEAVASVPDGASVAPGGFMLGRAPMALVFELVRQKRRGLHVISLPNPLPAEILVAAGAASKVEFLF